MADTGYSSFNTTVDKTNRVLKEIEHAYGWPKERRNQSYAALRGVLHALRDRLTVQEAAHFGAELPLLMRGIFYEGWNPDRVPIKMNRDDLLARVRQEFPFEVKDGIEQLTRTVFGALRLHVADGEWQKIRAGLPKDLAELIPSDDRP
ncbi:DUF2267 domain-containing protein [Sphaerisporangium album]|uniref:DUF2267 domain-containing protein n=1 Tax=Sphaerisporangium album TaxID=509200 RepID=A0A367FLE0_9ACTN|nr:DUF2267 domain-containing protein [Sphaerisporangium album]RCG30642.1 DUF2267 domain-containing protein [Sphaerisporangium album]